ncbi:hypothetical protein V8C37DRAFT_397742 [Trichoderma ceciliae]
MREEPASNPNKQEGDPDIGYISREHIHRAQQVDFLQLNCELAQPINSNEVSPNRSGNDEELGMRRHWDIRSAERDTNTDVHLFSPGQSQRQDVSNMVNVEATNLEPRRSARVRHSTKSIQQTATSRARFTSKEDMEIMNLEEEYRGQPNPWAKIFQLFDIKFPGRSQKSIQRRYNTKLNAIEKPIVKASSEAEDNQYPVERILARLYDHYLLSWAGYPSRDWIPKKDICPMLVGEFDKIYVGFVEGLTVERSRIRDGEVQYLLQWHNCENVGKHWESEKFMSPNILRRIEMYGLPLESPVLEEGLIM